MTDVSADAAAITHLVSRLRSWSRAKRTDAARELWRLAQCSAATQRLVADVGGIPPLVALLKRGACDDDKLHAAAVLSVLAPLDARHQRRMLDEGALPLLVGLLHSVHDGHKQFAMAALGGLARGGAHCQSQIGSAGAVAPLLKILQRGHDEQQRAAVAVLSRLASLPANRGFFLHSTVVELLVARLSSPRHAVRELSADLLGLLATDDERAGRLIVEARAIAPLVALLRLGVSDQQRGALGALGKLSALRGVPELVADAGAIPPLIQALGGAPPELQRKVVAVLDKLAADKSAQLAVVVSGAMPALAPLLQCHDAAVRSQVASTLEKLTIDAPQVPPLVVAAGAIPPLVAMLSAPDESDRDAAATLLWALSRADASHRPMQRAGAIPLLVAMLRSTNIRFTRSALMTLWYLAEDEENHRLIVDAGAAPLLVWLLETASGALQSATARCLASMAARGHVARVVDAGVIPVLVSILRSPQTDLDTKASATSTLLALASESDVATRETVAAGAVDPTIALFHFGSDDHKKSAIDLLCELAPTHPQTTASLVHSGATAVLVAMLLSKDVGVVASAARAIKLLTDSDAGKQAVVGNGGIVALNGVLLHEENAQSWRWAAEALCNLVEVECNRRLIVEAGCCTSLLSVTRNALLSVPRGRSESAAATFASITLWKLAAEPAFHLRIVEAGAIAVLTSLLARDPPVAVVGILKTLTQHPELKATIAESRVAILSLVHLLANDQVEPMTKTLSLELLDILADSTERRRVLIDASIIPELVTLLSTNDDRQVTATLVLFSRIMAEDFAVNAQLATAIPQLVEITRRDGDVAEFARSVLTLMKVNDGATVDDDALSELRGLLQSEHSQDREIALQKLALLTQDAGLRARVAETVPAAALVAALHESGTRSLAAAIIDVLAPHLSAEDVISPLVAALKMPLDVTG
ncbi:hypothetical protein P43SY_007247 [Pythium insidiosum]|uniref:Uncharacterized protein n=1 Tax=Pythium insidiosum TaxID=114742 RepID=A0AAD5LUS9_PYTIN|nr:hypothetical protein P43SY_007247 [Pythium insidiosum]